MAQFSIGSGLDHAYWVIISTRFSILSIYITALWIDWTRIYDPIQPEEPIVGSNCKKLGHGPKTRKPDSTWCQTRTRRVSSNTWSNFSMFEGLGRAWLSSISRELGQHGWVLSLRVLELCYTEVQEKIHWRLWLVMGHNHKIFFPPLGLVCAILGFHVLRLSIFVGHKWEAMLIGA